MKQRVQDVKLSDICEINIGRTPARNQPRFWNGEYPWLTIADMGDSRVISSTKECITEAAIKDCNCRPVEAGTVLLSFKLSIGKVGIASRRMFTNEAIAALVIRDTGQIIPEFLVRALQAVDLKAGLDRAAKGLTLNKAKLQLLRIPLPPLSNQRHIAEVLDKADELRAKRRATLAELNTLTQSIFLEMFGDPVANDRSWPTQKVSDFVAGFESGKSIVADDEEDAESRYRVLKVSAVTSLEFLPEESKAIPPDYTPPQSHIVKQGDLLFSRANTSALIGATAYVFSTPPNLLLPDKLWRFVWHQAPKANPHYMRYLFQQPKFRQQITKRATGTSGSMKNISQEKVLTIEVGLPPVSLQREFARRVTTIEALKAKHRTALAELDALFASLQHRAFRGEL